MTSHTGTKPCLYDDCANAVEASRQRTGWPTCETCHDREDFWEQMEPTGYWWQHPRRCARDGCENIVKVFAAERPSPTEAPLPCSEACWKVVRDFVKAEMKTEARTRRLGKTVSSLRGSVRAVHLKQTARQQWRAERPCGCVVTVCPADTDDRGRATSWLTLHGAKEIPTELRRDAMDTARFLLSRPCPDHRSSAPNPPLCGSARMAESCLPS